MKIIKISVILLFLMALSFAQSAEEAVDLLENQTGVGIRATGLGNAYTGIADDYSAIYWNPAGLAQIKMNEVSIALSNLTYKSTADYLGTSTSDSRTFTKLHNFGLVYPFQVERGSLVMALGFQRIKSLDSYLGFSGYLPGTQGDSLAFDVINDNQFDYGLLEFDRDIQQQKTVSSEGSLNQWSFGMGIDLSPNFSGGFTLSMISGGSDYLSRYRQDDSRDMNNYSISNQNGDEIEIFDFKYYDVTQKIKSDYSGYEAKLGGMFHLGDNIRLGTSITLPMTIRVNEVWSVSDELAYDIHVLNDGVYSYSGPTENPYNDSAYMGWVLNTHNQAVDLNAEGSFEYNIKVPFKFSGGVSYQNSLLLLAASAEYTDWSQLRYEMPDNGNAENYAALLDQNEVFANSFRPVLSWSAGAEVNLFKNALSLRGGYRFVPSPYKDATVGFDKAIYSAGLGMKVDESTVIEVSYTYGSYERKAYYSYAWDEYGEIAPMQTSEKHTSQRLMAGLKLIF